MNYNDRLYKETQSECQVHKVQTQQRIQKVVHLAGSHDKLRATLSATGRKVPMAHDLQVRRSLRILDSITFFRNQPISLPRYWPEIHFHSN